MMNRISSYNLLLIASSSLLLIWAFYAAPAMVPLKFDLDGRPAHYGSKIFFIGMNTFLISFVNGLIYFLIRFIESDPSLRFVNIPNKDYWIKAENRALGMSKTIHLLNIVQLFVNSIVLLSMLMSLGFIENDYVNLGIGLIVTSSILLIGYSLWSFKKTG